MAIYDDVVNRPLGGWIQRLVWCPTGDCRGGFRKRSTCDTTELLFRYGSPGTLQTTTDWSPPCCVERPGERANGSPGPKAPMETIPMHSPGQARQSQDRQKPSKHQAGVAQPSNVPPHPSPHTVFPDDSPHCQSISIVCKSIALLYWNPRRLTSVSCN